MADTPTTKTPAIPDGHNRTAALSQAAARNPPEPGLNRPQSAPDQPARPTAPARPGNQPPPSSRSDRKNGGVTPPTRDKTMELSKGHPRQARRPGQAHATHGDYSMASLMHARIVPVVRMGIWRLSSGPVRSAARFQAAEGWVGSGRNGA